MSKVGQDMLAYQYCQSYGLKVIRTRAFNHEGPRRGDVFVTSTFAKQIAEAEAGLRPPVIHHGNLDAQRDWTDVR
ncbi:GDP-mannose 4,6-dehydratase, partial [Acinetobacter baumannii]